MQEGTNAVAGRYRGGTDSQTTYSSKEPSNMLVDGVSGSQICNHPKSQATNSSSSDTRGLSTLDYEVTWKGAVAVTVKGAMPLIR
jgi:hypothetical protein